MITVEVILNLLISLIGGILAALAYGYIFEIRKKIKHKKLYYKPYHGKTYQWYYKNDLETPIFETTFSVKGNLFTFEGFRIKREIPIDGNFLIEENIDNYGKGFYKHSNFNAFGFIEVQLNEGGSIYIHSSYLITHETPSQKDIVHIGYIAEHKI